MRQDSTPGVKKVRPPTYKEMRDLNDKMEKTTTYLIPARISVKGKYTLFQLISSNAPCYIPLAVGADYLLGAGYKPMGKQYQYVSSKKPGWRRYASWSSDQVKLYLSELSYLQKGVPLWCEDIPVDFDYLLIVLYVIDPALYLKIKDTKIERIDSISIKGNSKTTTACKEYDRLESRINSLIFDYACMTRAKRAFKQGLDVICKDTCEMLETYQKVKPQNTSLEFLDHIRQQAEQLREVNNFEISTDEFSRIFSENIEEFDSAEVIQHPAPLDEADVPEEVLARSLQLIQRLNQPGEKRTMPLLTHVNPTRLNPVSAGPNEPQDLINLKIAIRAVVSSGKKLPDALANDLLGSYWSYDHIKKELVPVKDCAYFIPTIRRSVLSQKFILQQDSLQQSRHFKNVSEATHPRENLNDMLRIEDEILRKSAAAVTGKEIQNAFLDDLLIEEATHDIIILDAKRLHQLFLKSILTTISKKVISSNQRKEILIQRNMIIAETVRKWENDQRFFRGIIWLYSHYRLMNLNILQNFLSIIHGERSKRILGTITERYLHFIAKFDLTSSDELLKELTALSGLLPFQLDWYGRGVEIFSGSNIEGGFDSAKASNDIADENADPQNLSDVKYRFAKADDLILKDIMSRKFASVRRQPEVQPGDISSELKAGNRSRTADGAQPTGQMSPDDGKPDRNSTGESRNSTRENRNSTGRVQPDVLAGPSGRANSDSVLPPHEEEPGDEKKRGRALKLEKYSPEEISRMKAELAKDQVPDIHQIIPSALKNYHVLMSEVVSLLKCSAAEVISNLESTASKLSARQSVIITNSATFLSRLLREEFSVGLYSVQSLKYIYYHATDILNRSEAIITSQKPRPLLEIPIGDTVSIRAEMMAISKAFREQVSWKELNHSPAPNLRLLPVLHSGAELMMNLIMIACSGDPSSELSQSAVKTMNACLPKGSKHIQNPEEYLKSGKRLISRAERQSEDGIISIFGTIGELGLAQRAYNFLSDTFT